ncbi:MAG TPA: hypothetical protein VHZ73_04255 [Vicinamibacterales bacterium]|nr:hypothetical protein [Vicinamibacterales bacterium]
MTSPPDVLPRPPRWAEAVLRSCLAPQDRDAVSGDLLEEYREVVRPLRGRVRADAWYLGRAGGVFARLLWPGLVLVTVPVAGFAISSARGDALGFFSWVPRARRAPGVSLLDAVIYMWAAYYTARRTGLLRTGLIAAAACTVVNLAVMFVALAIKFDLVQTMIAKPGIMWIVILLAYQGIALAFCLIPGLIGATLGVTLSPWRRASL